MVLELFQMVEGMKLKYLISVTPHDFVSMGVNQQIGWKLNMMKMGKHMLKRKEGEKCYQTIQSFRLLDTI